MSKGQGTKYRHSLIHIVDPETIISMGYIDIVQQTCTAMDLKVREVRCPFPESITHQELKSFKFLETGKDQAVHMSAKPDETRLFGIDWVDFSLFFRENELTRRLEICYAKSSP